MLQVLDSDFEYVQPTGTILSRAELVDWLTSQVISWGKCSRVMMMQVGSARLVVSGPVCVCVLCPAGPALAGDGWVWRLC